MGSVKLRKSGVFEVCETNFVRTRLKSTRPPFSVFSGNESLKLPVLSLLRIVLHASFCSDTRVVYFTRKPCVSLLMDNSTPGC